MGSTEERTVVDINEGSGSFGSLVEQDFYGNGDAHRVVGRNESEFFVIGSKRKKPTSDSPHVGKNSADPTIEALERLVELSDRRSKIVEQADSDENFLYKLCMDKLTALPGITAKEILSEARRSNNWKSVFSFSVSHLWSCRYGSKSVASGVPLKVSDNNGECSTLVGLNQLKNIFGLGNREAKAIMVDITSKVYRRRLSQAFSGGELDAAPSKASFLQNICDALHFDPHKASEIHEGTRIYRQKLQQCVAKGELNEEDVSSLLRLRVLLCIPQQVVEVSFHLIFVAGCLRR
ncbi:hypothetical protein J5N97_022895 [Dioscorea zingiberensis]|uniref:Uncharacterized protein n=1 Tax=Dioscorea zingiberensis TaxID=325984 RepID=A0A9D5CBA0_9LILI|nr:hypothetical protein J5N97_022895 [Dioscorea zingiberensis]